MEALTITETAMRRSLLALVLAVCTLSTPASANYIRNGDFSQENLYWTDLGTGYFEQAYYEGASRFTDGWIEQSFTDNGGPLWLEYDFEALFDGDGYATWNGELIPGSYYSGEMTHLVFKVMGTGQDTLRIWGHNVQSYNFLDNVAVNDVPEPASMALLAAGCLGLAFRRRR